MATRRSAGRMSRSAANGAPTTINASRPISLRGRASLASDFLDLARLAALVEEGLQRTVKPQDREPALPRQRLDEISILHAVRLLGTEIDGCRAVGTRLCR